tara:strand:+ start:157 stop:435 length:279 start_codon:yes stop_codon:yes gene_type:complete
VSKNATKSNRLFDSLFWHFYKVKMETVKTLDFGEYIKKIDKVESMLKEIKAGLSYFDKDLQESIKRGEKDIKEGRVTICKTEKDLNNFFASI